MKKLLGYKNLNLYKNMTNTIDNYKRDIIGHYAAIF